MAYQTLANVYDHFMNDAPYDEWTAFTLEIFKKANKPIQFVADLGCGTGEITIQLANKGYTMIGIDYSEEMLAIAQQKASVQKASIQWLHQDLKQMEGLTELDCAISYCDVMNYITEEEELLNVFSRVATSLKNNGLFIFDAHSIDYAKNGLMNQTFADVTDESSYIWFCMEGDRPGEMYHDLTFFQASGDLYERLEEVHHQRTLPTSDYVNLLERAGFFNIKIYADFSVNASQSLKGAERIFFVAEKRPEKR